MQIFFLFIKSKLHFLKGIDIILSNIVNGIEGKSIFVAVFVESLYKVKTSKTAQNEWAPELDG
ncbi:hypothetical protein CSV65_15195 [Sporosarcina sp. P31]|nr:hypothetical protein CSV68_15550 [Sporosarcina sp. P29]PID04414.1 hypothetical protein CSV66_15140 [Sporosarcina sp. P30]PID07597.1 hypothetical protein CSV65_15195 [Sporosarcina sp. P31]PID10781.1 hypothetical protein CSV64_15245 [Sporosarcina sp. P32b]